MTKKHKLHSKSVTRSHTATRPRPKEIQNMQEKARACVETETRRKSLLIEIANKISVMKKQEHLYWSSEFDSRDYLRRAKLEHENKNSTVSSSARRSLVVDESCRASMSAWFYRTIDFFNMAPRTAEVAISCLDRFLGSQRGLTFVRTRRKFQVACVTALYIASKVHETAEIHVEAMVKLSRGLCNAQQIYETEQVMLMELDWKLSPPIATDFATLLVSSFPSSCLEHPRKCCLMDTIFQLIKIFTSSYNDCITKRPSAVAVACVLVALDQQRRESGQISRADHQICRQYLQQLMSCSFHIDKNINELVYLFTATLQQNQKAPTDDLSPSVISQKSLNLLDGVRSGKKASKGKSGCHENSTPICNKHKTAPMACTITKWPLSSKPSLRELTVSLFKGTISPVAVIVLEI